MFLGIEWYWWIAIVLIVALLPFKVKFMKWWEKRRREMKENEQGKWGDEE